MVQLLEKLKMDPQNPNLYREAGLALMKENRLDEAMEMYSKGLIFNPFDPVMRYWRGRKYMAYGQFALSASDLKIAAAANPEDWECWYYLGVSCYLCGLYGQAKEAHEKVRALMLKYDTSALPATCDWYWMICMKMGLKEEAESIFQYVTPGMETVDPDYRERVLLYKGYYQPEDFLEKHRAMMEEDDRNGAAEIMLTYGLANYLHYQGRDDESAVLLKKVAESPNWRTMFAVQQAVQDLKDRGVPFVVPEA